ncbi:hypothetical protein BW732_08655 [Vagococcus penaei]|uniref:Nucleoside transporter/FeoB GTPase Gate domain-containing protein n=1 Tax=Vagococcus penaei TaxID=633807 RepID=A0A1Q2D780_9ENTE|nr:hypothetical protein BW732_08655 [Vagococcus penaei]
MKKTALFSGEPAPFIMELPNYHWPRLKNSFRQTIERSKSFVKKAGTIIFACSVFIWFLSSFNWQFKMVTTDQSLLALLGKGLAPLFVPLGWGNWQATVATLTGLIAKENVVGTFGILYAHLPEISETGKEFWPLFSTSLTPVAGYSFLLFNLLCAPCFAAVGAIRREMSDWRWTTLAISYQCGLAYLVSFLVYQLASVLLGYHSFSLGTGIAITLLIGLIGWLILPQKKPSKIYQGLNFTRKEEESMSTIIISVVIFSLVILVVYRYGIKKKSSCDCSVTDCPINKKHL